VHAGNGTSCHAAGGKARHCRRKPDAVCALRHVLSGLQPRTAYRRQFAAPPWLATRFQKGNAFTRLCRRTQAYETPKRRRPARHAVSRKQEHAQRHLQAPRGALPGHLLFSSVCPGFSPYSPARVVFRYRVRLFLFSLATAAERRPSFRRRPHGPRGDSSHRQRHLPLTRANRSLGRRQAWHENTPR